MKIPPISEQTEQLIRQYGSYRLRPFRFIIDEIIAHFGSLEALHGKKILELGPGSKLNLLVFLIKETPAQSVHAVGRYPGWSWMPHAAIRELYVENAELYQFLKKIPSKSFDLIYSRHVMEAHSIHPFILLGSREYWRAIKQGTIQHPDENFPASIPNLQAAFKQAFRTLNPGGVIISQIAKKKHSALDDGFLAKTAAKNIRRKMLGRLSEIVTVVKK